MGFSFVDANVNYTNITGIITSLNPNLVGDVKRMSCLTTGNGLQ